MARPLLAAGGPAVLLVLLALATPVAADSPNVLANGGFESGLAGWAVSPGSGAVEVGAGGPVAEGAAAAHLVSTGSGAVRLVSAIGAAPAPPGARHVLALRIHVDDPAVAEVRVTLSPVGAGGGATGPAIATLVRDSAAAFQPVTLHSGPEPPGTVEMRVEVRMTATAAGARISVDDVRLAQSLPPPTPTASPIPSPLPTTASTPPTPAATATPAPLPPSATATATSAPAAETASPQPSAGGPRPASSPPAVAATPVAPVASEAPALLRITEAMPDPVEPGRDADWEWVEITNVGVATVALDGVRLRDNTGEVTLPNLVLEGGRSLVVAGRLAELDVPLLFVAAGGIGNGLGNSGDRLVLIAAGGEVLDAFSYGSDTTYVEGGAPRIAAPGPGRSIRRDFDAEGRLLAASTSDEPTPGHAEIGAQPVPDEPPLPAVAIAGGDDEPPAVEGSAAQTLTVGGATNRTAWLVLLAAAGGALIASAVPRARSLVREARGASSGGAGADGDGDGR